MPRFYEIKFDYHSKFAQVVDKKTGQWIRIATLLELELWNELQTALKDLENIRKEQEIKSDE